MTYADGYRAGIEAAARLHDRLSEWAYEAEEDPKCGQMHRDFAERIRALAPAAPEPSEAEVGRVARAICSARGYNPDCEVVWGEKSCKLWEVFAKDARAALASMGREDG